MWELLILSTILAAVVCALAAMAMQGVENGEVSPLEQTEAIA